METKDGKWLLAAWIELGERYGHEEMRRLAKAAMRKRGAKRIGQLTRCDCLPVYEEVKQQLSSRDSTHKEEA